MGVKQISTAVLHYNKMNRKAGIVVQLLVMMILVVLTSAVIFYLVQSGIITVKAEEESVPLLNAEFIPIAREGYLSIEEFKFCDYVDQDFTCINQDKHFFFNNEIHFTFVVESSTYNGEVMILENYRIKSPSGKTLLDAEQKNNFHYDIRSKEKKELITFKDYFIIGSGTETGAYTLELIIENPLLNKKKTLSQEFLLELSPALGDSLYEGE